jgi:SpoVK/Ycf46/Vps4 family AAA+-type ATPase
LQEGASKFAALLVSATPGIIFIDEVYQLDPNGNADGRAITNALMEASENDRDKLTIIAAGYREDVVEKWCSFNPGIMSRFPFEIVFEDFNESELRIIFLNNLHSMHRQLERYTINDAQGIDLTSSGILTTVDVAKVAATRLYKGANKRGFGNARAVRVLVEKAQRAASKRQKQEQLTGQALFSTHGTTMTLIDVIGPPIDISLSPIVAELMAMTGLSAVKKAVMGLLQMLVENYQSELRGEAVLDISLHRMFLGNPGTGKTSIAKVFGRILVELGYLTNGEVIVVGASKLVGGVMGATPKIVNDLVDSVLGKVLVIDEAYVLARANNTYRREALDTLVERVQGTPFNLNTLIP